LREIENISELRNRVGGRNLAIVKLLGKSQVNDGYAGVFYWSSQSTQSDDGESIVKSNFATIGRWIRVSQEEYLVDLLTNYFITNSEDIDITQILNAFNVELRDVNEKRLGFIIDPNANLPEIEATISNLTCCV